MLEKLKTYISQLAQQDICIAFSGGVDSSLLLKLFCEQAHINKKQVYAVTFSTKLHPPADIALTKKLCQDMGANHIVIELNEFQNEAISNNPIDRCYHCKKLLFESLKKFAGQKGIYSVIDGTNADDLNEYRPGLRALKELNIKSPLAELGISKNQIRKMAQELQIAVANRPSAPCLATRLPYGTKIDIALLMRIDASEEALRELGFLTNRIRIHQNIARIEINIEDMEKFVRLREQIILKLKNLGVCYVTLDLEGFRSGSMDIEIEK